MVLSDRCLFVSSKTSCLYLPTFRLTFGLTNIVYTLSTFSSVLLVTVTVTRKMFTMILSVLWFGHSLTQMQWLGVGLVFGAVGVEGAITRHEKATKEKAKKLATMNGGDQKKEL